MAEYRTTIEINSSDLNLVEIITEDRRWMKYIEGKLSIQPSFSMGNCKSYYIQKSKLPMLVSHFIKGGE